MPITTVDRIAEGYNDSVDAIYEAFQLAETKDLGGAMKKLASSATLAYQSLEWMIKNYLLNIYTDPILNKKEIATIEAANFWNKFLLFVQNSNPAIANTGINFQIILDLKRSVRNDAEHSGLVPHFESLKTVIK